jgi:predicted RNA-binding Zn ribbon-like protein
VEVGTPEVAVMLHVTWEWLGFDPALDVANTIAISNGKPHDLLEPAGEYERWATEVAARSPLLDADASALLLDAKPAVLALRARIREVMAATAAGEALPAAAVAALNRASRAAPAWLELDVDGTRRQRSRGGAAERLLAEYARSAMEIAADGGARLRVCPAPSCGMYYRPTRPQQRWCSVPCGTRARVARHSRRAAG